MKKGTKIMAIVSVFILIAVLATFVLKNIHEKKQQRETIDIFEIASEIQETETLMETRKAQETEPETMAETQETEPEIMTEAQETEPETMTETQETEPETQKTEPETASTAEPKAQEIAKAEETAPTGIVICIDPGHYKGASNLSGDNFYGYEEGIFTLRVALALKQELAYYGIDSYLTRETDSITIGGYTNGDLDKGHIGLRGEYAKDADLFVSIHTNANNENANGCPTCQQPMEINKTIVIVNQIAAKSDVAINVANQIGMELTKASYEAGLTFTDEFDTVDKSSIKQWTDTYNDMLNALGTVCCRIGNDGDYYGVLKGSANIGVPGMIVEHGFHTVEEMRRLAMTEDLAQIWARADAYGIAKGFGIVGTEM